MPRVSKHRVKGAKITNGKRPETSSSQTVKEETKSQSRRKR